jgi:hypothetical protein
MIWLSIWLPDRMPRSVETSKMTVWVGICSLMAFRTTDAFVRLLRRLLIALEHLHEMPLDGVGDDVLVDFGGDYGLGGLVDLDDLFDLPVDVVGKQRGDIRH